MTIVTTTPVPTAQPASNAFKAIVRSLMPFVYSIVAGAIAHFGYHVANTTVIQIVTIAGGVLTIVLHALETQWPAIGVFLGYIGAPVYAPSTKVTLQAQLASVEAQFAAFVAQSEEAKAMSTPSAPPPVVVVTPPPVAPTLVTHQ
jgi:hypothetical protein